MKPIIIANWKMNPQDKEEAVALFDFISNGAKESEAAEVAVCPPSVFLGVLKSKGAAKLGAQNIFWEEKGAYTGEISCDMAKNFGCDYVLVGHSERRKYFGETDEMVNKKLKAAINKNLIPVFCMGETQEERDRGEAEMVLERQIKNGLLNIPSGDFKKIVVAYEPVWAIGTGNACDVGEAKKMGLAIRNLIANIYGQEFADSMPILYGGSVKSGNSAGYIKEAGMNGLLVGGASLIGPEFIEIIKSAI